MGHRLLGPCQVLLAAQAVSCVLCLVWLWSSMCEVTLKPSVCRGKQLG
jgi:hypothetical protein